MSRQERIVEERTMEIEAVVANWDCKIDTDMEIDEQIEDIFEEIANFLGIQAPRYMGDSSEEEYNFLRETVLNRF